MSTYPQSLCCYVRPAGSFQSLNLCRREEERAVGSQRENVVHCSILISSVLNPTGISKVDFSCFGALYLTDTMVVVQFKNSYNVCLALPNLFCVFMDNQMRWDQTGPTEAK